MSDTSTLLEIRNLTKRYRGGVTANDDISLTVGTGEVFGLLGPNGAGKSTLVNQCIGLLEPTSGSIRLDGTDLVAEPAEARRLCSYLPQGQVPIDSLTVEQAVEMVGRIRGGGREAVRRRADRLIESLQIGEWRSTLGTRLSGGVRRLTGFMMAAVWPGRLLILDEPTNDVDPVRRRLLWREIRRLAGDGTAVLLVTHNVLEAERAVERLAIIDRARIRAEGTPASMKSVYRGRLRLHLTLAPRVEPPTPPEWASDLTGHGRRLRASLPESEVLNAVRWARELVRDGCAEEYELAPPSLEDTYVDLLGREAEAEEAA